jgi:hypothetical protein
MGNWHVPCKTNGGTSGCQHLPQGLQLIESSARGQELNALIRLLKELLHYEPHFVDDFTGGQHGSKHWLF